MSPINHKSRPGKPLAILALLLAAGVAAAQTPAPPKLLTGDPCAIVPLAEVQKAFPGSLPGARRREVEQFGINQCVYNDSKGYPPFIVSEHISNNATVMQDAQGEAAGYVSPFMATAKRGERYEKLGGLGVDAVAFFEAKDEKRGILGDGAFVVLRKGQRVVALTAPMLQGTDRAAGLKLLEQLGRVAARRLN